MNDETATDEESAVDDDDNDVGTDGQSVMRGMMLAAAATLVVALITVAVAVLTGRSTLHPRPSKTFSYVIPFGTSIRVANGQIPFDVFPSELEVQVGDTITIRNNDSPTHIVGPFTIRPNETLTYVFRQSGSYQGLCTVHGNGHDVIILVRKAVSNASA